MITTRNCIEIFGNPNDYKQNLIYYKVPREILMLIPGLRNPYNITRILLNPLILKPLDNVLSEICFRGLEHEIKSYDGCFLIRPIRGKENDKLVIDGLEYTYYSLHSWGLAVDINAKTNPLGEKGDMHPDIISIFKDNGFDWGGNFHRTDSMHFQASKELLGI